MPPPGSLRARLRFADFEVDFRSGELHKQGRRIRLQGQPLRVLGMLLEQPGELVTREELRLQLWPADTFVDFDHGLNSAVARLRESLNDSADEPRYVETVHAAAIVSSEMCRRRIRSQRCRRRARRFRSPVLTG